MEYPPFENCRLTTMTLVFILNGSVSLEAAFSLLPVTKMEFSLPKRQKKKFELPHCPTPGAILSMRYSGETRGIIRSVSGNYFKNSITIDLSTISKNVSIKLSQSKIQMCGASSEKQGREGAQYLIDHLLMIQDDLDYLQAHRDLGIETLNWIKQATKGKPVIRPVYTTTRTSNLNPETGKLVESDKLLFDRNESDFLIQPLKSIDGAPDTRIAQFLSRHHIDFEFYSFFVSEMEWIFNLDRVTTRPLTIRKIHKAMVNYNYNLGFTVDRYTLCQEMLDRHGFISSYDNCVEHCVKIKLPYIPDDEAAVRRKNKIPCHCFLVYRSGVVTQTGPGEDLMKQAYNLFWESILEIKDRIMIEPNTSVDPPKRKVVIRRKVID